MHPKFSNAILIVILLVTSWGTAAFGGSTATHRAPTTTPTVSPVTPTPTVLPDRQTPPPPIQAQIQNANQLETFPPNAPIVVTFTEAITPGLPAGQPALYTFPWVEGDLSWDDSAAELTFQPKEFLPPGSTLDVYLHPGLRGRSGAALAQAYSWEIVVGNGPQVLSRTPAALEITNRLPKIVLSFDRPMDAASLGEALDIQPPISFTVSVKGKSATLALLEPLAFETLYRFTLGGSARGADGVAMAQPYAWSYRLAQPQLTVSEGPTLAKLKAPLKLALNYPGNSGFLQEHLVISPAIVGNYTWANNGVLSITPVEPLPWGAIYRIGFTETLTMLTDTHGLTLPVPAPITFTAPIPIEGTYPSNFTGEDWDYFYPYEAIRINFVTPMDRASVEAAFQLDPPAPGSFTWEGNSLTFQPTSTLKTSSDYTATLLPSAKTADGFTFLDQPYRWAFRTTSYMDAWSSNHFGEWGSNIQLVDAYGQRLIQFQNGDTDAVVGFELYKLDLQTFVERYREGFRTSRWPNRMEALTTEGATLAAKWTWTAPEEDTLTPYVELPSHIGFGLYILTITSNGEPSDRMFVVVTANTLVVKRSSGEIFAWLSDIDGKSVGQVEMRVYAEDGSQIQTGETDDQGAYRASIPAGIRPLLVVARTRGGDYTLSGLDSSWMGGTYYERYQQVAEPPRYLVYTYTDRPIYRPEQTVYFKSLIRRDQDVRYTPLPTGTPVEIRIHDSRDNILETIAASTNEFGSVNGQFWLTADAMTGEYVIEVIVNGESSRQIFKVENYRKPEFQASLSANAEHFVAGEPITLTIQADYFFGKPVANAKVDVAWYRLYQLDCEWINCTPEMEDEYYWNYIGWDGGGTLEGSTDENGQIVLNTIAAFGDDYWGYYDEYDWNSNLRVRTWGVKVFIEDADGQTASSSLVIKVSNTAEKLSLDMGGFYHQPGKPFTVYATVLDMAGQPVAGRQLALEVLRWNSEDRGYSQVSVLSEPITTTANGKATLALNLADEGYYQVRLTGQDRLGNLLEYEKWLYVYRSSDTWATALNKDDLRITAEQSTYKPYQTAQFTIESTFSGPALLTFERGRVNRAVPVMLTAPLTVVAVPIIPEDAPNIFVTINAWQTQPTFPPQTVDEEDPYSYYYDRTWNPTLLRKASVELTVEAAYQTLQVTITPDQTSYAPRQTANFTIKVTNAQGKPVSAELSLALVDKAIYRLSGELTPSMLEAFYGRRKHTILTYNSFAPFRVIAIAGRGGGGGGGDYPSSPRSNFPDTAAWLPVVRTDAQGIAAVSIQLPDNLTTWQLRAKAITAQAQVGEGLLEIVTQQPVVVRPLLPRFLTAGDQVWLTAAVHNYSGAPITLTVATTATQPGGMQPVAFTGALTQTVALQPDEARLLFWEAAALHAGEMQITFEARSMPRNAKNLDPLMDSVQITLPIQSAVIPDRMAQTGQFDHQTPLAFTVPTDTLIENSAVRLTFNRSLFGSLLQGLEFLTGYPYGCVEQTMSRALPNAVVGRAFRQAGSAAQINPETLQPLISAGLQRLYSYQHTDGGWGWWYDDSTDEYQTAWVVFGLVTTSQAGYTVEPRVIQRGAAWLGRNLEDMDPRLQAYALYSMALAGSGDLEATRRLAGTAAELDPFSQAAVALALHELEADDDARAILDLLMQTAAWQNGQLYWAQPYSDGEYHQKTMSSSTRSTALVLDAFVQIAPEYRLPDGSLASTAIANWLMRQRRPTGWGTTNETAYAILALSDYLQAQAQLTQPSQVIVSLNTAETFTLTLTAETPVASLEITASQWISGANFLLITQDITSTTYYQLEQEIHRPRAEATPSQKITIERSYLDAETGEPISSVEVNQWVWVKLKVTLPQEAYYLIVEDRLPAGLEAVNSELGLTSHHQMGYEDEYSYQDSPYYQWEELGYNRKEIRDDRVSFFITHQKKGTFTITYLARAAQSGAFIALPAETYAMYDATLWGRSPQDILTIERVADEP